MKSPRKAALLVIAAFTTIACQRGQSPQTSAISTAAAQTQTVSTSDDKSDPRNAEPTMLPGPNAIPRDTRIVVNIPAFRMDLFQDGALVKSYKIGIGYPEFPLPRGFRKAEMIIFNPTWTQPNESWASNPGEVVPAGAKGNPLGPIKIPIGGANLIHGGKPLAKIGTFASHGCVGLTNDQVKDFARVLADATRTELSAGTMASYLKHPARTQVMKLTQLVPVELRYETIVAEDRKLHIYRDVYGQNTNTEENLRAVLEANGITFEKLSDEEKSQVWETLNVVSRHPKKLLTPTPTPVANQTKEEKLAAAAARRAEAERQRKLRRQREFVIDIATLTGKGYPAAVNLNTGAEYIAKNAEASTVTKPKRPRRNPTPAPQSIPEAVPSPRSTASPQ